MTPEAILTREIKKYFEDNGSDVIRVEVKLFEQSECWVAIVGDRAYLCEIGSDDDGFLFTNDHRDEEFYILLPSDWPV